MINQTSEKNPLAIAQNPLDSPVQNAAISQTLALFSLLNTLHTLFQELNDSASDFSSLSLADSDFFAFGELWPHLRTLSSEEILAHIDDRLHEIAELKELWRGKLKSIAPLPFQKKIETTLAHPILERLQEGYGGAYALRHSSDGEIIAIVKPNDEDILCLNNSKHLASPLIEKNCRVRENIPLYQSVFREVASYDIAKAIKVENVMPSTFLSIIPSDFFFSLLDRLPNNSGIIQQKEKLCSVQEFVPHINDLFDAVRSWEKERISLQEMEERISQEDFEDAMILVWILYDTDAHAGNFLVYKKSSALSHRTIFGLKKIDNSLALPEKNQELTNSLAYLPNAQKPLSEKGRERILHLPIQQLTSILTTYNLLNALPALLKRIEMLQTLARRKNQTLFDINEALKHLELDFVHLMR